MNWSGLGSLHIRLFVHLLAARDILILAFPSDEANVWSDWWSYDGISGPDYWGLLNSDWKLCTKGRYQSPINIQPDVLVFDPSLAPLRIEKKEVKVTIVNTGHDITLQIAKENHISVSGGPLAYKYKIYEVKIHFGSDGGKGSEHRVAGSSFPVEIQFMAFNEDLYSNITYALNSPHGLAAIAVLAQVDAHAVIETDILFDAINTVVHKGDHAEISSIILTNLMPATDFYMTYDGSLTFPPCYEVVTWVVMNRPIVLRAEQVDVLRKLHQGDKLAHRVLMSNNFRTTAPLKNRTIRTNIKSPNSKNEECVSRKETKYAVNDRFRH